MCDNLVSVPKSVLTDYVGALGPGRLGELADALRVALELS
jgi:mRNA-degrading endonuclease toxin of MazEF toxin-antitoxin module